MAFRRILVALAAMAAAFGAANAETPQERAQKIKDWRANCSDPDADLRAAYIEAAVAGNDQTVLRACVSQALTSDNVDTQNLALRAMLASAERLTIEVMMPAAYDQAIAAAKDDAQKVSAIEQQYSHEKWAIANVGAVIGLVPKKVDLSGQASAWHVMTSNRTPMDVYVLDLALTGETLAGTGGAAYGQQRMNFSLNLALNDDGYMVGAGDLAHGKNFRLRMKLQ